MCAWLLTSTANAQQYVNFTSVEADYGQIAIAPHPDTAKIDRELADAVDSLKMKDGILLDLRRVSSTGQIFTHYLANAVRAAFNDYTKPTVVLISGNIKWESPIGIWVKEREWTKFESSGELKKAEVKLKTLHGRYLKEGQERMDWLMQNEKKSN
jgi:hypothetical protein